MQYRESLILRLIRSTETACTAISFLRFSCFKRSDTVSRYFAYTILDRVIDCSLASLLAAAPLDLMRCMHAMRSQRMGVPVSYREAAQITHSAAVMYRLTNLKEKVTSGDRILKKAWSREVRRAWDAVRAV